MFVASASMPTSQAARVGSKLEKCQLNDINVPVPFSPVVTCSLLVVVHEQMVPVAVKYILESLEEATETKSMMIIVSHCINYEILYALNKINGMCRKLNLALSCRFYTMS